MVAQIIDGKAAANQLQEKLKVKISSFERAPTLAVILVGHNPASEVYVRHKAMAAEKVGIHSTTYQLSPVMTQDALVSFIRELNDNPEVDGILVQLPLPSHMNASEVLEVIRPDKDVDGLTARNLGKLFAGYPGIVPCTPRACIALLNSVVPNMDGLQAVVVGRSRLVGKPVSQLLLDAQCTVAQAHSHTKDLAGVCRTADILVVATGKPGLIGPEHVKPGAVVIDVGIHRNEQEKLCGDVQFDAVKEIASYITPVPGGVGPMTVAMLLQNVVDIYLKKSLHDPKNMVQ